DSCYLKDLATWKTIGMGSMRNGLYHLDKRVRAKYACSASRGNLWHCRLGHPSQYVLNLLPDEFRDSTNQCFVCPFAKMKRFPFVTNGSRTRAPFEIVHVDIWGPVPVTSVEGFNYFLTLVDDHSRTTWIYLLCNKSEARTQLKNYISYVSTHFDNNIKTI